MKSGAYVLLYLLAAVAANLAIAAFGPGATAFVGFVMVGCDITVRDALHERWQGRQLWRRLFALILSGSALSYWLNADAARIALASACAFAACGLCDSVVYQRLLGRPRWARINGSNVVSAAVDSVVFPLLAFGPGPFVLVATAQFIAKVAGGGLWSLVLGRASAAGVIPARVSGSGR